MAMRVHLAVITTVVTSVLIIAALAIMHMLVTIGAAFVSAAAMTTMWWMLRAALIVLVELDNSLLHLLRLLLNHSEIKVEIDLIHFNHSSFLVFALGHPNLLPSGFLFPLSSPLSCVVVPRLNGSVIAGLSPVPSSSVSGSLVLRGSLRRVKLSFATRLVTPS